ncbi:hypothetical protein JW962_03595 [Candidatus Dojkabacteria bacterium]|nr:hypothetical protein [Candidatus Dojkabacteria bacterium]
MISVYHRGLSKKMSIHKNLLTRYLRISEYFKKPLSYSFVKLINAPKSAIPKTHKLINGYIVLNETTLPSNLPELTKTKVKIAKRLLFLLWLFPFVKMIALSGSVAAKTPAPDDDIDVIIITDPKALWLTRILDHLIYRFLRVRRVSTTPKGKENNLLCINTYLADNNLVLRNKDIFSAFQLLSITPLYGKNTYQDLISSNSWLEDFIYGKLTIGNSSRKTSLGELFRNLFTLPLLPAIWVLEPIAKYIQQKSFAKHHKSLYFYNNHVIETYPRNTRLKVLSFVSTGKEDL